MHFKTNSVMNVEYIREVTANIQTLYWIKHKYKANANPITDSDIARIAKYLIAAFLIFPFQAMPSNNPDMLPTKD